MFSSKRLLSGLAATLAATLFLSGCGGGSNNVENPTPFFFFPTAATQFAFVANLHDSPQTTITEFVLTPSTGALTNGTPVAGSAASKFTVTNGFDGSTPEPAFVDGITQFGSLLLVAVDAGGTTTANGGTNTQAGLIVCSVDPTTGNVTQESATATPTFDSTHNGSTAPDIGDTDLNGIVACNDPVTAGVVDVFVLNNADTDCSLEGYTVDTSTFAVTATSSNFEFAGDGENIAITSVGSSQVLAVAGKSIGNSAAVFGFAVGGGAVATLPVDGIATVNGEEPEGVGLLPSQGTNTVASGVSGDDTSTINEFTVDASGNIVVGGSDTVEPNNTSTVFTGVNFAAPPGGSIELMLTTNDSTNNVVAIPTTIGTGLPVPNKAAAVLATTAVATGTNGSTLSDQSTSPVELVTSQDAVRGTADANNVSSFIFPAGVFDVTPQTGSSGGSEPVFVTSKPTSHHH